MGAASAGIGNFPEKPKDPQTRKNESISGFNKHFDMLKEYIKRGQRPKLKVENISSECTITIVSTFFRLAQEADISKQELEKKVVELKNLIKEYEQSR